MLPRSARLRRARDIALVSAAGSRTRVRDVGVSLTLGSGRPPRATVVVGRRAGGAVARNRQRRRLQHAVASLLPELPAGSDLVVRGGPGVAALSPAEMDAALGEAIRRSLRRARAAA